MGEMKLREAMRRGEKLFEKMNERFERDMDRRVDKAFEKFRKELGPRLEQLTQDQSEDAAPLLALIQRAQAAATKASAAEKSAATKKAAVEAEVVAKGTAYGLDQSSANSLFLRLPRRWMLWVPPVLWLQQHPVMLSAGAMIGSLAAGRN